MNWTQIVDRITPYVIKIETPAGHGTGFMYLYNEKQTLCGVATAAHVVAYADEWQQPIKVTHHASNKFLFLKESERVIFINWETDSAVILFPHAGLELPKSVIPLFPSENPLGVGVDVGWLGFPAIEPYTLCFFSGTISARQEQRNAYLIDGVAINGVSGGPVIYSTETEGVQIIGTVSAYKANRTTGDALPGLLIAQDVSHFHYVTNHIKSMDEANRKKQELEKAQKQALPKIAPEEPET